MLWARSGNMCARCKCELVIEASGQDQESVVGDECHILPRSGAGPRGDHATTEEGRDEYGNLLLLCKVHHKQVDDQRGDFPPERLRAIKADHEQWVRDRLSPVPAPKGPVVTLLDRIESGKALTEIISTAVGYMFEYPAAETPEEAELIGGFNQLVQDWGAVWSVMEPAARVKTQFDLTAEVRKVEAAGLMVYAGFIPYRFADQPDAWQIAVVCLSRRHNPAVMDDGRLAVAIQSQAGTR